MNYPWRKVVDVRPATIGGGMVYFKLACGHERMSSGSRKSRRFRCTKCPLGRTA